ncbi:MAG: hypothetical protein L0Y75_02095 [Acidobacteria bacterium]|nr:hypothetical protein [Acidobacteriota bacterium]
MITVKVCYESSGEPAKNKRVAIGVDGLLAGGVTSGEWTDSNGEAHFDIEPCNGEVFVDGSTAHRGYLKGRIVIYI